MELFPPFNESEPPKEPVKRAGLIRLQNPRASAAKDMDVIMRQISSLPANKSKTVSLLDYFDIPLGTDIPERVFVPPSFLAKHLALFQVSE